MYCNPLALCQPHPARTHLRHLWLWLPVLTTAAGMSLLLLAAPYVTLH